MEPSEGDVTVEELAGGLRFVAEEIPGSRSVAIGIFVGTGSRDEPDSAAGLSHLVEHIVFKGTPTLSARDIAVTMDALGGEMNGFTSKEQTYYYVRTLDRDAEVGLSTLAGMLTEPAIREADLVLEKQVVIEEIRMHLDEPQDLCAQRCQSAVFPGHPLGREVSGTVESVEPVTPEVLRSFFGQHYRSGNIVAAAAGRFDSERLAGILAERWTALSGGSHPERTAPSSEQAVLSVVSRPTEQASVQVSMRGLSRHDETRWAAAVLDGILGGTMSSRLFQEVREERGLAYSIWSDTMHYDDAGTFDVGAGCAPGNAREVIRVMVEMLEDIASAGVKQEEIELARSHFEAELLLSLESPIARMARLGSAMLHYGRIVPVDEVLGRIRAVESADVSAVAAHLLKGKRSLSVVGPFKEEDFSWWG